MATGLFKWLLLAALNVTHPFFVCVTEVNHNAQEKTLEITCRIFTDDFEKVLTQKHKKAVHIAGERPDATLDQKISGYIKEHLSFKADDRDVAYTYLGFEKEEDVVYCFLQVSNIASVKKIESVNSMLHDLNENQINIMHVTVGGKRKSTKLDFPQTDASFEF